MPNVRLSWNPNPSTQLVHAYQVWEQFNGSWNLLATVTEPTFVYAPPSGALKWRVRAVNFVGESEFSAVVDGPTVPTPPDGLTATVE